MSDGLVVIVFAALLLGAMVACVGSLMYMDSDLARERARFRRERNDLRLERERRQTEMELKLLEWQSTASLEDLERHRHRLAGELDEMHRREEG